VNSGADDRTVPALADSWIDHRRKQAERGELSLKRWAEDQRCLKVFQDFLEASYPSAVCVDQIDPGILNAYRDAEWSLVSSGNGGKISKVTLRKRLATVVRWLRWLVDENILAQPPKDLTTYGRVKLDKPKPVFYSPDEIEELARLATERTKLYIMLALNCGYTQKDIATLEPSMIDWETGIITRDRHKTGVPTRAKLWPSSLALLRKHRNPAETGLLLIDQNGSPLYYERVNDKGKLVLNDSVPSVSVREGFRGVGYRGLSKH
jgi:integrase